MSHTKEYKPTDSEADEIARAMLLAAAAEIAKMDDDGDIKANTLACLRAFAAAGAAERDGKRRILRDNPGHSFVSCYPSASTIVCTAMFCHLTGADPLTVNPESVAGAALLSLIGATKVLEGMSNVYSALDDDDEVFGTYLASEAASFAAAHPQGEPD